jgi:cytochrome c2
MTSGLLKLLILLVVIVPGTVRAESAGEKLFNRKCTMCHVVKGRGGAIGPDLTTVATRMSESRLQAKIAYPKKTCPGTSMPSFATLGLPEMQALISYLKTLR